MPAVTDQREEIYTAIRNCRSGNLSGPAKALFETLGYHSERTTRWELDDFLEHAEQSARPLTIKNKDELRRIKSFHLIFQIGDAELSKHGDLFESSGTIDAQRIQSYLFFAVDLPPGQYTRTELTSFARLINKPLPMPAIILFRHGEKDDPLLSLAILRRRLNKRDASRDVLEKATLIKDIRCAEPLRAHIEILNDFSLPSLREDEDIPNFVKLHAAWEKKLDTKDLSKQFYQEIADWYFWSRHLVEDGTIRLPLHCDTEEENSLFLIRLLTRVIFCWFLIEKRLIPTELFREKHLLKLLKDFTPSRDPRKPDSSPTYYRAILQNLFFGTLNMPPEQRAFRKKKKKGERYDANYGITNLWRYETSFHDRADWETLAARVPFLNGGLFDCLDDKSGKKQDNFILDGFSDREDMGCHLPNDLFFGTERTVDLSKDYGEEKKKTARSKRAKVRGLIEILSRYKFTIEENTPLEEEIALDPELLGKVFENLLASYNPDTSTTARKALGAFYTPREIVSYMVDEALKSYLASQVPKCKGALEDLFSNKATLKDIQPGTREALIAAIGRVKILDPACGSGAFPMGALHRLVDLLQKLDPNNESWKRDRLTEARRYRELLEESGAAKDEIAACDTRIAEIEKSFDTRYHALDFARKLYLIENCIYGVDIQPIATQIAKLRFFISLVVDQKVEPNAANLGVRPLPNLETRLVAADTLIPIETTESDLFSADLDRLRAELAGIRHKHFNARSPADKRKWREADEAKRQEIAEKLEDSHALPKTAARQLAAWDPYDQNTFAPFFDSEWMFGLPVGKVKLQGNAQATLLGNLALINEAGGQAELAPDAHQEIDSGFDIVIGNPPYIRIQTLKQKNPKLVAFYKGHYDSAAKGNYDIYVVFIEAGLRLLKSDGHLAYICPHKFFNADYGEPTRTLISKGNHLRHVVHFGDEQVFFGATIYTCLLFLAKEGSEECRFVKAHDLENWMAKLSGEDGRFAASTIGASNWNFTVGASATVFARLQLLPVRFGDVAARISQGVRTSANEVYVLDVVNDNRRAVLATSKQLGTEIKLERDSVRLFLQGREIKPFCLLPSSKIVLMPYSIADGRAIPIAERTIKAEWPHAYDYLKQNKVYLQNREQGRFTGSNWYEFGRNQNIDLMLLPKLLVPDIADRACFALDEDGQYAFTSGYGITFNDPKKHPLKFMLGLCNSRVLDFYWRRVSTPLRGGFFRYFTQFIEQLPVADATQPQKDTVIRLVNYLNYLNRHFTDNRTTQTRRDPLMVAYWERVLNGLVYELYFPEELHAAGLRLFDLVAQAKLPEIDSLAESERLATLRQKFEELHDGAHPLRIALDKLQTLDTVRIIEGKA